MSLTDTCRSAWNSSKKPHQPDYDDLIESYRNMLSARAEGVLATGMCDDGPFAGFEQAVLNYIPSTEPEPVEPFNSDQGFEQVIDEPFYDDMKPDPAHADVEAPPVVPLPDDPGPKKRVAKKAAPVAKKVVAKKPAVKKVAKPKVIKKGKK